MASISPISHRRVAITLGAALFFSTLFLYAPVRNHGFLYCDDDQYVFENPIVRQGLTVGGVVWAFTRSHAANWHPLTWLSHMADVELFGMDPGSHHLVNVGIHATNGVLLFAALTSMTGAVWPAAATAALFALHPLRVESVAWIAERKDVLSGLFWMLTLLAYTGYARRPGGARYLGVLLLFTAGLLAKPMVVTLPCVLFLLDEWPLQREATLSWRVVEKLPLFALSALSSLLTVWSQAAGHAMGDLATLPLAARMANALTSYTAYLGKAVLPFDLSIFYPHPAIVSRESFAPLSPATVAAALLVAGVTLVGWRQRRQRPYLFVGWLWYLVTLVPVIGLVQVGEQAMADRYTYLPLIGITLAVVWGGAEWAQRWPPARLVNGVAATGLLLFFALLTWREIPHWRDTGTVFDHALAVTTENYFAWNHLGRYRENRGDLAGAADAYRAAIRAKPGYTGALSNLGNVLAKESQYNEAEAVLRTAIRENPRFGSAWNNLGVTLMRAGRQDEAIAALEQAVAFESDRFENRFNLGSAYARAGELPQAERYLRQASQMNPEHLPSLNDLGVVLLRQGKGVEAAAVLRAAAVRDPTYPDLFANLGLALEQTGDREAAAAAFETALRHDPTCAPAHRFLGYDAIRRGDLDAAVNHLERLHAVAPDNADLANDLGYVHAERGELVEARHLFEEALRLDPANTAARRNLDRARR